MKQQSISQRGQSIIEVIFATVVVALVLVAVLSTILASLRNSRTSLEQTRATKHAEEVLEWIRQNRTALGWAVVTNGIANTGDSDTYCLTQVPSDWASLSSYGGVCERTDVILNSPFRRELTLTRTSETEFEAEVTLTWPGKTGDVTTTLQSIFARW